MTEVEHEAEKAEYRRDTSEAGADACRLLPCPFCGDGAQAEYVPRKMERFYNAAWQVRCFTCGARGRRQSTKYQAETAWNARARQPDMLAVREALNIEGIQKRLHFASDMVSALCLPRGSYGARSWLMSIPARPNYDPDLVISAALGDLSDILSLLATPPTPPQDGWQSIETAPRDGFHMLLYRPRICFVGYYAAGGDWVINATGLPIVYPPPTHWMPLPKPPTSLQPATREKEGIWAKTRVRLKTR